MNNHTLIAVWDPVIRLFHWSLVVAFFSSWLTQEEYYNLHLATGYVTLGLICLRIVWGIAGPRYARFTDFIYSPSSIFTYLKSLRDGYPKRFIGHNPAAGVMIMLMLIGLLVVTISGIALDGAENWSGPMAEMNLFRYTGLIQSIHVMSTDVLLALIVLHLMGVIYSSKVHRENLVRAMITGTKRSP